MLLKCKTLGDVQVACINSCRSLPCNLLRGFLDVSDFAPFCSNLAFKRRGLFT